MPVEFVEPLGGRQPLVTRDEHPVKLGTAEHMTLAYELGRQAFLEFPACDGLYMGGGAWIAEPVAKRLEEEFGRPVICNTAAMVREACKTVGAWEARQGFSRVMAAG